VNPAALRLKNEFELRRRRNPEFSVRAFARWLGASPAQISQVLSGKRALTTKMALKFAQRLDLSPREKTEFVSSTSPEVSSTTAYFKDPQRAALIDLEEDKFRAVSDWQHFAILSLTEVKGAKGDPRWIARRLGINVQEANAALERLRKLGLLAPAPAFKQVTGSLRVLSNAPSEAIRKYHSQNLLLALERLEGVAFENRDYQSLTVSTSASKLAWFRRRVDEFLTEVSAELESGPREEVYTLGIQFFPVTRSIPNLKENIEK
jgi:uncharacterized protein (TIGR02147 family)